LRARLRQKLARDSIRDFESFRSFAVYLKIKRIFSWKMQYIYNNKECFYIFIVILAIFYHFAIALGAMKSIRMRCFNAPVRIFPPP
jgi:hypothetical protein